MKKNKKEKKRKESDFGVHQKNNGYPVSDSELFVRQHVLSDHSLTKKKDLDF